MGLIANLLKLNLIPLIGICTYSFIVIGLTILGGKLLQMAGLMKFDSGASEKAGLPEALVIAMLAFSFSIIIAVNTYRPAPAVVMPDVSRKTGGGCGSGKSGGCGSEAKKAGEQPANPAPSGK